MVREVRSHDDDEDTDFGIMNSAVSTESMDMAEEVLIHHSFIYSIDCLLSYHLE